MARRAFTRSALTACAFQSLRNRLQVRHGHGHGAEELLGTLLHDGAGDRGELLALLVGADHLALVAGDEDFTRRRGAHREVGSPHAHRRGVGLHVHDLRACQPGDLQRDRPADESHGGLLLLPQLADLEGELGARGQLQRHLRGCRCLDGQLGQAVRARADQVEVLESLPDLDILHLLPVPDDGDLPLDVEEAARFLRPAQGGCSRAQQARGRETAHSHGPRGSRRSSSLPPPRGSSTAGTSRGRGSWRTGPRGLRR